MRIRVVAATGFIGPHIVQRLIARGHQIVEDEVSESDAVVCVHLFTQEDADAAVSRFRGRTGNLVVLSSGDVYRAYGKLQGTESGGLEPLPITEDSRLRTTLYPYRGHPKYSDYEKILVERTVRSAAELQACVLRLPAVYGPGDRYHRFGRWVRAMAADDPSISMGARMSGWRWTHGYVENVADAIAVAATDPRTRGRIYNIGEEDVPTMRQRIEWLAGVCGWKGTIDLVPDDLALDFSQDMAVSTARFRADLDFNDPVSTGDVLSRTFAWEQMATDIS